MKEKTEIQNYVDKCKVRRKKLLNMIAGLQYPNSAYWQVESLARQNLIIDTLEWVLDTDKSEQSRT